MPTLPLVSIIIPTYNRAHLIGETLDSVLAQTYANWECIVVDDGSTDDTEELMAEYISKDSRFQYHHRPKDRLPGGNAARNYGFEMSKGEYINWFDSDDYMFPTKLERQLSCFIKKYSSVVCLCRAEIFSIEKRYEKESKTLYDVSFFEDYISRKLDMGTNQPLWKKDFLITQNLYDENLLRGQDFDFFARISILESFNFCFVDEVLVSVRLDSENRITDVKYSVKKEVNYLTPLIHIYQLVLNRENEDLYIDSTNVFLKKLLPSIRKQDVKTAQWFLKELKREVYHNKVKYKLHYTKLIWALSLLKILNYRGYSRFMKIYYLK